MRKNVFWTKAHAEAGQVAITEGEEDDEEDEPAIVVEQDGQVMTRMNVTQHEKRDEEETTQDGDGKHHAVLPRPHTEGREAPPGPVTQVEEEETADWDEELVPGASVGEGGPGVRGDGGVRSDGDGEVETDQQSQQPDLLKDVYHGNVLFHVLVSCLTWRRRGGRRRREEEEGGGEEEEGILTK